MKTYTVIASDPNGIELARRTDIAEHELFAVSDELSHQGALTIVQLSENGTTRYVLVKGKQPVATRPALVLFDATGFITPKPAKPVAVPPASQPAVPPLTATGVNQEAKTRIDTVQNTLRAAGFKGVGHRGSGGDGEQFFTNGTELYDSGKDTLHAMKTEYDDLGDFQDAADELSATVVAESRTDIEMTAEQFAKYLEIRNGKITMRGFRVRESAMRGLLSARLHSPALSYIIGLRERIVDERLKGDKRNQAAMDGDRDKIAETLYYECMRNPAVAIKVRLRAGVGDCFACTSLEYKPADAPEVVKQILPAIPAGTKGSFSYDPDSTAWELRARLWTPTPEDLICVGEPIDAYTSLQSADNGSSSFRSGGGCTMVRCKNCTVYISEMGAGRRRHIGKIMTDINAMVVNGTKAIQVLMQAWGTNREVEVEVPAGLTIEDAIPGWYKWLLSDRSSEMMNVLPGRKAEHAKKLALAYFDQRRDKDHVSRADLAQGMTRYAQEFDAPVQRAVETSVADWLVKSGALGCDPDGK